MKNNYLLLALLAFVAYKVIYKKVDKQNFDLPIEPVDADRMVDQGAA